MDRNPAFAVHATAHAFRAAMNSVVNLAVFPRIWACVFVELRMFLMTCGLVVFGLV